VGWLFSDAKLFSLRIFFEIWDDCEMPTSGSDSSSFSIFRLEDERDGAGMVLRSRQFPGVWLDRRRGRAREKKCALLTRIKRVSLREARAKDVIGNW
jgi:hypothetical protein